MSSPSALTAAGSQRPTSPRTADSRPASGRSSDAAPPASARRPNKRYARAAVIGREFELGLLARVIDQNEEHVLDVLDAAIRAALIGEVPQRPGRLSFSHALTEHTLYDDLGPTRRQRLHRRVAVALETLCGDNPGDRLGELAYHWAQAGETVDTGKAIEYALPRR